MPIHVKVLSEADYTAWVQGKMKELAAKADDPNKVWAMPELVARGEKVFTANCAVCHKADGSGAPPTIKALNGSPVVNDADKGKQLHIVLTGTDKGMPSWKQLSDTDIAAVVTYTKNSWSNKTGQLVQPADVVAARK
jgi:cytochrome c oxidase subunit 2